MTTTTRPRARSRSRSRATAPARPAARSRARVGNTSYVLLFAVLVVLNLIGLVMVLSASSVVALEHQGTPYYYFLRQVMWLVGGCVIFVLTLRVDYHRWRRLTLPILAVSVVLLLLVFVPGLGVNANGSSRWLGYGNFGIQPSEFAKLSVLLFTADLLSRRRHLITDTRATLRPVLVVFAVVAGLILLQPNLGTTIVLACIVFAVLFTAGVPIGPQVGNGADGVLRAGLHDPTQM
jgi:cell division protein FtsW